MGTEPVVAAVIELDGRSDACSTSDCTETAKAPSVTRHSGLSLGQSLTVSGKACSGGRALLPLRQELGPKDHAQNKHEAAKPLPPTIAIDHVVECEHGDENIHPHDPLGSLFLLGHAANLLALCPDVKCSRRCCHHITPERHAAFGALFC